MLFNSFVFLLAFPIIFAAYYLCPIKWRNWLLLLTSYAVYMNWVPVYGGGADWPDIVEGICAKYSIPYYNYLSDKRFANNKTYFVDSSHLNDNGARAYTEIVAADIKCKLKTRCLTSDRFYESSACQ